MHNDKGKLEWLEFDRLEPYSHVVHGVFERHGGMSQGPFASLNVSHDVGDHPDAVKTNRERIAKALSARHIVFPNQVHGTDCVRITSANATKTHQADALYTTEKNIALAATHADCQAAIFYDPTHDAIGVVHAGWRGSVQNVYGKFIDRLKSDLNTAPKDLIVCISPSLGPCHAEFKNYKTELPKEFWDFQVKPHFFDFWAISKMQLINAGVLEKNIELPNICTYCTPNDYYSFRRDSKTGRNATLVLLR